MSNPRETVTVTALDDIAQGQVVVVNLAERTARRPRHGARPVGFAGGQEKAGRALTAMRRGEFGSVELLADGPGSAGIAS